MAQVKLKIEVNPNAETEKIGDITNKVNDIGSKSNLSNVSIKAKDNGIFIVKEMNNNGRELLSFGESGSLKFTQDGYLTSNGITKGELASEQNPDMFVWGVVPSNKAYNVNTIKADALEFVGEYDLVVSNPPYIAEDERESLSREVLCEPETALFAENQGLLFYRKIAENFKKNNNVTLMIEIGFSQAESVSKILDQNGYLNIQTIKDLNGLDRVIVSNKK